MSQRAAMVDFHPARFLASRFLVLPLLGFSTAISAERPLLIAELEAARAMAAADADRADARCELDMWQLSQLRKLRDRGHASWQEVAQQEVRVKSAKAFAQMAGKYLQAVIDRQSQLKTSSSSRSLSESECMPLYMPQSVRLVAWIPAGVASRVWSQRHLEKLRGEHRSLSDIDLSPLETAIEKAERGVQICGRSEQDADLLRRAEIQLRIARAEHEIAKARKAAAIILARRMDLVRASLRDKQSPSEKASTGVAELGTRFVDATSNRELARLVESMASAEVIRSERIIWLENQYDAVSAEIEALRELSQHTGADPAELEQAQSRKSDIEMEIRDAHVVLTLQQQVARDYRQSMSSQPSLGMERSSLDEIGLSDANVVRLRLELKRLELHAEANHTAVKAQHDYLSERLIRVERIPQRARPPKELDHLHQQIRGCRQQLAMADHEIALLGLEQQRLNHQLASQRGWQYQLVQAADGRLIRQKGSVSGRTLVQDPKLIHAVFASMVGFIGDSGLTRPTSVPKWTVENPRRFAYFESTTILDCMSTLHTQRPLATQKYVSPGDWFSRNDALRLGARAVSRSASGLRLADDEFHYPSDFFCVAPFESRLARRSDAYIPRASSQTPSSCQFQLLNPYENYPFGNCGMSIFSYRAGAPTRSSYPYRSSYLYRTAFPTRTNIFSSPRTRPATYRGFGYPWWRDESCFD